MSFKNIKKIDEEKKIDIDEIKELTGLTWAELADRIGYSNRNKMVDISKGRREMRGPSATALSYFAQGVLDEMDKTLIPEFTIGDGFLGDNLIELVHRNHYPRFIAKILGEDQIFDKTLDNFIEIDEWEGLYVVMWLDRHDEDEAKEALARAKEEIKRKNEISLENYKKSLK